MSARQDLEQLLAAAREAEQFAIRRADAMAQALTVAAALADRAEVASTVSPDLHELRLLGRQVRERIEALGPGTRCTCHAGDHGGRHLPECGMRGGA